MFWIIAFVALGYFLYSIFIQRFVEKWGHFGTPEWVMLAIAILFIPVMVYCALRAVKHYRATKAKQAEELKKYQEETALRKQRLYLEEDDELPAPDVAEDDNDDWEPGDGVEEDTVLNDAEDDDWEPGE